MLTLFCDSCVNETFNTVDSAQLQKKEIIMNEYLYENYKPRLFKYFFDTAAEQEYFVFLDESISSIKFIPVEDTIIKKEFSIEGIKDISDFIVLTFDSIIFLGRDKNISIISDASKYIYDLTDTIPVYRNMYEIGSFYTYPFAVIEDNILVYNFPSEPLDSKPKLLKYFSTCRDTRLKLVDNQLRITGTCGKYPDNFKENNFYVYSPIRTIGADAKIIYSFDNSTEIFIYEYKTNTYIKKSLDSPGFSPNQPFEYSKIFDYNYISKYLTESDRFGNMIYDPFKKLYYRISAKGIKFENDNGTVNKFTDKPFNVLIYDIDFNLKNTINFPSLVYDYRNIFFSKEGIVLITANNDLNTKRKMYVFSFH
jgi:hypothetical protein